MLWAEFYPSSKVLCWSHDPRVIGFGGEAYGRWLALDVHQSCISSPCLFNLYVEYIMQNTGLDEAQARIKFTRRNISNLRYADDATLMAEGKEKLKSLLMKVKKLAWGSTFRKLRSWHLAHHFMANRWVNSGNSERLYFFGLQNHCRWWLQPWSF